MRDGVRKNLYRILKGEKGGGVGVRWGIIIAYIIRQIYHFTVHPSSPQQVKVREKDNNWIVEWTPPPSGPRLWYQVWYYRSEDQVINL